MSQMVHNGSTSLWMLAPTLCVLSCTSRTTIWLEEQAGRAPADAQPVGDGQLSVLVAIDDILEVTADSIASFDVLANDLHAGGAVVAIDAADTTIVATAMGSGGLVRIAPVTGFVGTASFTYSAVLGVQRDQALVTVNVTPACYMVPHATFGCFGDDVFWLDACGAVTDLKENCGPGGCNGTACLEEAWFAFGDAEFAPWSTAASWGSGGGGGISRSGLYTSASPSLTLDTAGSPLVAWAESVDRSTGEIYLAKWDGNDWVAFSSGSLSVGGISQTATSSNDPVVRIDGSGRPTVAWSEVSTSTEIYLRRWDGSSWAALGTSATGGGISNDAAASSRASLAFNPAGEPVVAWTMSTSTPIAAHVYVRQWNTSAWVEMGAGSASGAGVDNSTYASNPALTRLGNGNLLLAWIDGAPTPGSEVYAKQWTGAAWTTIGTGSASGGGLSQGGCDITGLVSTTTTDGRSLLAWNTYSGSSCGVAYGVHIIAWNGTSWSPVTDPLTATTTPCGFSVTWSSSFALALDRDQPVVFRDGLRACAWRGGAWEEIGPGSATGILGDRPDASDIAAEFDAAGTGYLTWQQNGEIYALRFNGSQWESTAPVTAVGSGLSGPPVSGFSFAPVVAVSGAGAPMVAWFDLYDVFFKIWDGADWVELDGSASGHGVANSGGAAYGLELAWHADTGPLLAWAGFDTIWLARWDGAAWSEVGLGSKSIGIHTAPTYYLAGGLALAVDDAGLPVVAWGEGDWQFNEIYVLAFDGAAWVELGPGSGSGVGISNTALNSRGPALGIGPASLPIVAWEETVAAGQTEVYVRQFDGAAWVELDGSASGNGLSQSGGNAATPALIVGNDDLPIVAWSQEVTSPHSEIYVRRWNGTNWVDLGADSAQGGGVSATAGISMGPHLALDGSGRPVVVWNDNSSGNFEILIRRWDGLSWAAIAGTAGGGGVSNSTASGWYVDVDVRAGLICVTWDETGPVSQHVLLRCTRQ